MSDRNLRFQQQTNAVRDMLGQVSAVARDWAKENDAGTWGVDGWVRTIHNLIELQVTAYAAFLNSIVTGSAWAEPAAEPLLSEPIDVTAQSYPRTFTIVEPFVRLGLPPTQIPNHFIAFDPPVLPHGATRLQVTLNNYDFIGSNYTGTIGLCKATAPSGAPPDEVLPPVTVGL